MPMQYVEKWTRVGDHTDSINSVAFSPDGVFLASGGMDGNIVFSDVDEGKKVHIVRCHSPVLSLKWVLARLHELWVGVQSGSLLRIVLSQEKLGIHCFSIHRYPIEHLALDHSGTWLATGAQQELKVWRHTSPDQLRHVGDIPLGRAVAVAPREPILITSVHWLRYGEHSGCLLVTYLYHGIICYEPSTAKVRWSIPLNTPIGHAALHPDETSLAIMNQTSGVDVWKIPHAILDYSFSVEMEKGLLIPVAWIDEGARILTGSELGRVHIWNTVTQRALHPLPHADQIIRAVGAHYNEYRHIFRIATGNAECGPESTIRVFEAMELCNNMDRNPNFYFGPRSLENGAYTACLFLTLAAVIVAVVMRFI